MVSAAALIQDHGVLGHVEGAIAQTLPYVHEHIREIPSVVDNIFRNVCAFAGGVLTHVNGGGFWCSAVKFHGATDGGRRSGINGRCRCSCNAGSRGRLRWSFLFLTTSQCENSQ